jgi:hypothetical protein
VDELEAVKLVGRLIRATSESTKAVNGMRRGEKSCAKEEFAAAKAVLRELIGANRKWKPDTGLDALTHEALRG